MREKQSWKFFINAQVISCGRHATHSAQTTTSASLNNESILDPHPYHDHYRSSFKGLPPQENIDLLFDPVFVAWKVRHSLLIQPAGMGTSKQRSHFSAMSFITLKPIFVSFFPQTHTPKE